LKSIRYSSVGNFSESSVCNCSKNAVINCSKNAIYNCSENAAKNYNSVEITEQIPSPNSPIKGGTEKRKVIGLKMNCSNNICMLEKCYEIEPGGSAYKCCYCSSFYWQ
jgi:hypothetical protein